MLLCLFPRMHCTSTIPYVPTDWLASYCMQEEALMRVFSQTKLRKNLSNAIEPEITSPLCLLQVGRGSSSTLCPNVPGSY